MRLFYKNNGTISVFLCLILLPVILVGGMTVDASRIALSKVVISDAGEMAMNAGLAQYNEELHDEYGLLVMEKSPESMTGELQGYFNKSLNGTGLPDSEDYQKILDLLTENFEAVNVAGSEIYRTEVEKQQIIEYMKYRAPVCLTELVVEKIGMFNDTKLMVEATDAQMDFSEAMEDCQDTFQKALDALTALDQAIESFPSDAEIRRELENAERDYKGTVSRCLLMRAAIQRYDSKSQSTDLKEMAEGFINAAKKVDLSAPDSSGTFNAYIDAIYYANSVSHLGGINKLLQEYDGSETDIAAVQERAELQKLVNDYNKQSKALEEKKYANTLLATADNLVNSHFNVLNTYRESAKNAEQCAKQAYKCLEDVKKALNKAEEKFEVWNDKYDALKERGIEGDMQTQIDEYKKFFTSGTGKADLQELEELMGVVASNEAFFKDFQNVIKNEKFFNKAVVSEPTSQMNEYISKAFSATAGVSADYSSIERTREGFIFNYQHIEISSSYSKQSINNEPFYIKLQEYCKDGTGNGDPESQKKANNTLDESENAGGEANSIEGYPDFDWGSLSVRLPSSVAGTSVRDADSELTGLNIDANVSDSGARRSIIKEFRDSIKAASSFLDGVDQIVAKGIENLYVAEYAMQMFSYYTIDKQNGQDRSTSDIISLSGYELGDRPAYRGEVEYILWGNQSSQTNVRNTIMLIFGVRMLFNSFYAFSDQTINGLATAAATAIAAGAPYLIPVIKVVIKLGYAGVETANDITKIKQGYGVTVFKDSSTWSTLNDANNDNNTKGVTFNYSEYLRIFLNVSILASNKNKTDILSRIADCIQADNQEIDLFTSYTMLQINAEVRVRTTFMRKISDFGSGGWGFPDDTYPIKYQSILGY